MWDTETDGGEWTIFKRRIYGIISFYRDDVDSLVGRFASTNGVINLKCFLDDELKQGPVHFNSCKDVVSKSSRTVVTLSSGLEVMCDTETDGGGWTIFQRRIYGNVSFYRGWEEYKRGFGDVRNDFYLGNENIYRITSIGTYELRVDFEYNKKKYFAKYSTFSISNEYEAYKLLVSGYLGNAGDSIAYQNGMKFSTFDIDQDIFPENCAVEFQGGWWYKECHQSNLNGLWGNTEYGRGLNWMTTTGYFGSATMTEMKLRKTK
ncbi:Ryncolin-4 [Bulinus truncatus]|nr:Ryncolin-4 [Bulinus truncatus]